MTSPRIELIIERTCPNVEAAREVIRAACIKLGIETRWREWDIEDIELPVHAAGYGSPTILVDGVDVANERPDNSACCRLYQQGTQVVPALTQVIDALTRADRPQR